MKTQNISYEKYEDSDYYHEVKKNYMSFLIKRKSSNDIEYPNCNLFLNNSHLDANSTTVSNNNNLLNFDNLKIDRIELDHSCDETALNDTLLKEFIENDDNNIYDKVTDITLADHFKSFDKNYYIDMLIKYYMYHADELRLNNNELSKTNTTNNDSSLSIILEIKNPLKKNILEYINSEISLNDAMKVIIDYCNPKYFTFITTFMLMSDIIEESEGSRYLFKLKKVFLSCFYVAAILLEEDPSTIKSLFYNWQIESNLVDKACINKIVSILLSKSLYDLYKYQLQFEKLYKREYDHLIMPLIELD